MAINRQDRAKQFAPFEALNGLRQALAMAEREHEKVPRSDLSDESKDEIEQVLSKIQTGSKVRAIFYEDGYYLSIVGNVTKLDTVFRSITIGEGIIRFDDLYGIAII